MHQTKQEMIVNTAKRHGLSGLTNIALRYYQQNKQPIITNYLPTALQVEITTACNLACTMCEHSFMQEIGRHLGFDEFKKLIDANPTVQVVNLTGIGEALLNPAFLDMIRYAKSKGIYVWFSDNFTLMTQERINGILDAGVDYIIVSLDGATKETYEKIRVKAKFETVVENFKKLKEERDRRGLQKPLMGVNMVVLKENYHEIEKLVHQAHAMGADDLMYVSIVMSDNTGKLSLWELDPKDIEPYATEAKKTAEELGMHVIAWPTVELKPTQKTGCAYPWLNPYIGYNGNVIPCCYIPQMSNARLDKENIMGNIFEQPLSQIWNNEKYQEFRKKIKTKQPPKACLGCAKFYGQ
jgi:radical SAM protein with 4Fe4S-binding SPASM domain